MTLQIKRATRSICVPLTQGLAAVIDADDAERILRFKWHAFKTNSGYYAARNSPMLKGVRGKTLLMHRVIANVPDGLKCDHKNLDTLDNRKSNLRHATQSQNGANSRARRGTSKFKGVNWDKGRNKWIAFISAGNKRRNLGRYESEELAAKAYDTAAIKAFGEFARTNF